MYCWYRESTELRQYPIERSQRAKCESLGGCDDKVDSGQDLDRGVRVSALLLCFFRFEKSYHVLWSYASPSHPPKLVDFDRWSVVTPAAGIYFGLYCVADPTLGMKRRWVRGTDVKVEVYDAGEIFSV
jgi:hypothetical protein